LNVERGTCLKGNRLTFKGVVDFEKDDIDLVIAKIEEMLAKIREKQAERSGP